MDNKVLLALFLSLGTVLAIQFFWGKKSDSTQTQQSGAVAIGEQQKAATPGQPVKVITTADLYRPIKLDINFVSDKLPSQEVMTEIDTKHYKALFSSHGAVLTEMHFKEHEGKSGKPLHTLYRKSVADVTQWPKGCFLVALEEKTPYVYSLLSRTTTEKATTLIYQAEVEQWFIRKVFTLYNDNYQIDMKLEFEPKPGEIRTIRARLTLTAPFVPEVAGNAINLFTYNDDKGSIEKIEPGKTQGLAWYWNSTSMAFGGEDRYFVHAMIKDPKKFVQRAYVKQYDQQTVISLFEGPEIKEKSAWAMSFYVGPKVADHLALVDDRLSDLMSFGWLSWICKMLLKLLDFIHDYIGNYGYAIIVVAIVLRLPFVPLSIYSRRKMEEYQRHQPTIQRIRLKYRQDVKTQHEEIMRYHQEHNLSTTTPLLGCMPLLIQMPILFALYRVLGSYLDLYQAPFAGWIVDLSAKDPFYVTPILLGLTMIWQQKMTPSTDGKQQVMMFFLSLVMTVFFANCAAGLVLYWLVSTVLNIGEDYIRKIFFAH